MRAAAADPPPAGGIAASREEWHPGYGERVTRPGEIVPALERAIAKTREGTSALLEFTTAKATAYSLPESF